MKWRFFRNMLPLGIVLFLHGLHASHHAPQTYDDPNFVNKMILVAIAVATIALGHLIQKAEGKLRSTH